MNGRRPQPPDERAGDGRPVEEQERPRRRLRWALYAYPREVRRAEGDMLISLACDILDGGGSSINREAVGLLRGGLTSRLGAAANAPWEPALRRAALQIAGALLAIACGAVAWRLRAPAWPGWSWAAVLTAPALVLVGHLAGRRALVACGGVLLLALGVAHANSDLVAGLGLEGSIEWIGLRGYVEWLTGGSWEGPANTRAWEMPLLACALPGAVVLLASAAHQRRPVPRSVALRTVAWVTAGAVAVRFTLEGVSTLHGGSAVIIGDLRLDGLAVCMVAASVAAVGAMAVGFARRRRDPAGMLAGTLAVAAILPVVWLYGLPFAGVPMLVALAVCGLAMVVAFLRLARHTSAQTS